MSEPIVHQQELRQAVQDRLELHWPSFAQAHPHLAQAIERTVLVETTVEHLADDPAFRAAMEAASRDEMTLSAASKVVGLIDQWVGRLLGL